jgi:hypothetical protein
MVRDQIADLLLHILYLSGDAVSADIDQDLEDIPSNAYLIINARVFPLDRKQIMVGRSLDNQLVINDPSVSRNHARLVADGGKFIVIDMESTNGTSVNGHPVEQKELRSGDTVSFADVPTMYIEYSKEQLDRARDRTSYPLTSGE